MPCNAGGNAGKLSGPAKCGELWGKSSGTVDSGENVHALDPCPLGICPAETKFTVAEVT